MFRIYQDDSVVAEGESPLAITGIDPNTNVSAGEYKVVRVDGDRESERVDIPAFTTLPIAVTGLSISPQTSTAEAGTAGNRQITATVEPENATNKNVSYNITPSATGLTVSDTGRIDWTADTPAGVYVTEVTTEDGNHTANHSLTLTEPEPEPEEPTDPEEPDPDNEDEVVPESIEISPKEHTYIDAWEPYTSKYFNVTILPEDADQEFTVESSDESVIRAIVDGNQAASQSVGAGTATLTVRTSNGLTDTATVTVPEQD